VSTNMGKASLSDLSASRIMAVIFGGFLSVIGLIAVIATVVIFATGESSSMTRGIVSILIAVFVFAAGLYLCRMAFRSEAIGEQSRFAYFADKGLALIFGLVFTGLGFSRVIVSVVMLIRGMAVPIPVTIIGAGLLALGVVLLRKVF